VSQEWAGEGRESVRCAAPHHPAATPPSAPLAARRPRPATPLTR
jgi:hypothetical protein